jgi:hypothetical protein
MTTHVPIHHDRAFAEIKRLSLAGLDGPELLRKVAGRLELAIPFEAFSAATTDPATNLITRGVVEGVSNVDEAAKVYYGHVYFEEDLHGDASMFRERRPVELLSERTKGKLERSMLYRELLRPPRYGHFGHKLFSIFADGSPWGRLTLMRAAGDPENAPKPFFRDHRQKERAFRQGVPLFDAGGFTVEGGLYDLPFRSREPRKPLAHAKETDSLHVFRGDPAMTAELQHAGAAVEGVDKDGSDLELPHQAACDGIKGQVAGSLTFQEVSEVVAETRPHQGYARPD